MSTPLIRQMVLLGDSLTDRGTMDKRKLFGIVPMRALSGLEGNSPLGRFTNGYTWADAFSLMLVHEFQIAKLRQNDKRFSQYPQTLGSLSADAADVLLTQKKHKAPPANNSLKNSDIADGLINQDKKIQATICEPFELDNDLAIFYNKRLMVRSYAEGGLTAKNYRHSLSFNPAILGSRKVLTSLEKKRKKLFSDDEKLAIDDKQKKETLVIEWSGSNDLVTVNKKPTIKEAHDAVDARIDNLKTMMAHGYKHFILFNLPNLALTPRFMAAKKEHQNEAKKTCEEFNRYLSEQLAHLKEQTLNDDEICIQTVDVAKIYEQIYYGLGEYSFDATGFDIKKRSMPYITSNDHKNQISKGYLFWDDVHPMPQLHYLLAKALKKHIAPLFSFLPPCDEKCSLDVGEITKKTQEAVLVNEFKRAYAEKISKRQHQFFWQFKHSKLHNGLQNKKDITLNQIVKKGLVDGDKLSLEVMRELEWIDKDNGLMTCYQHSIPLKNALTLATLKKRKQQPAKPCCPKVMIPD